MRIAIPSDDRSTIASHFGRAAGFLVFHVDGEEATFEGFRPLEIEDHACLCDHADRPTRHEKVLDVLAGCKIVIARGMGAPMYDDLLSCGFHVALTTVEDARTAVRLLIAQRLPERPDLGCETGH